MLRLLSVLAAVACLAEAAKCPQGYDLNSGRCIRPLNLWVKGTLESLLPQMTQQCDKDGAHLPIIKSAQDQKAFNDIVVSFPEVADKAVFLVLGMVCNPSTRRLEWVDHSSINYIQPPQGMGSVNLNFDCVAEKNHVVSRVKFNDWFVVPDDSTLYTYTFLCEAKPDDGLIDCDSAAAGQSCIKIHTDSATWKEAEKTCEKESATLVTISSAEENNYIRRTANGLGIVGAVHIGAYESPEGSNKWLWAAGDAPVDMKGYTNFADPFPMPGAGSCTVMVTSSTSGFWTNTDCDKSRIPYVCKRQSK